MLSTNSRYLRRFSSRIGLPLALLIAVGASVAAAISALPGAPHRASAQPQPSLVPSFEAVAAQLGLDERHMAIAELSGEHRDALRETLNQHVQSAWGALESLVHSRDLAMRRAQQPPLEATDGVFRTSAQLRSELTAAQVAVAEWHQTARVAALAHVPATQRQTLDRLYQNRGTSLPLEFRVEVYTPADVVALRDALSERHRRASTGEGTDPAGAQLIQRHETIAVLAARQRLQALP